MQHFLIKGFRKLGLLKKLNFSFRRSVNHHSYSIPLVNGNGQQNFIIHEEWMQEVLIRLMRIRKGSFIDVGVNVGQTLMKVKSIDPEINYYGFEPNPTCVYYINQLIELNSIRNVTLFPVAIAEKPAMAQLNFYYDSDTDSAASMIKGFRPQEQVRKTVMIPCFSLNEVKQFIDLNSVSIIKVDVEGAELEVLKGLDIFLSASRPFIIMEILPVYQVDNKERLERQIQIESILTSHRYTIFRIKKSGNDFSDFEELEEIGIHSNQDWCDYVFCPSEFKSKLTGHSSL
jgi:FkbM family methyltransferase